MQIGYGAAYRRAVERQLVLRGEGGYAAAVGGAFEAMGALQRDLAVKAGLRDDGFLIDIGCGAGRLTATLRDWSRLSYLGLDVSPKLIAHAKELAARPDWKFALVSAPVIPAPDSSADMVTMFSVATHLPLVETRAYFQEAARALKRGSGVFLVSFLDPEVAAHRRQVRPAIVEAIVTKLFWAPNVVNSVAEIRATAASAGFVIESIESPSVLGQSLAVLKMP